MYGPARPHRSPAYHGLVVFERYRCEASRLCDCAGDEKKNAPRGRVMILQFAIALAIGIYVVLSKDVERTTPHESLPPLQRTGHRFDRDSGLESDFAKVDLDGVLLLMSREIPVVASICEIAFEAVPPSRKIRCQNRPRAIIPRRPTTGGKSRGRICPRQRQSVGASARKQSTHPQGTL